MFAISFHENLQILGLRVCVPLRCSFLAEFPKDQTYGSRGNGWISHRFSVDFLHQAHPSASKRIQAHLAEASAFGAWIIWI
jgi:hypothetical protein